MCGTQFDAAPAGPIRNYPDLLNWPFYNPLNGVEPHEPEVDQALQEYLSHPEPRPTTLLFELIQHHDAQGGGLQSKIIGPL
jgi:hypothetical protein